MMKKMNDMINRSVRFNDQQIIDAVTAKMAMVRSILNDAIEYNDVFDHEDIVRFKRIITNCKVALTLVQNETFEFNVEIENINIDLKNVSDKIESFEK